MRKKKVTVYFILYIYIYIYIYKNLYEMDMDSLPYNLECIQKLFLVLNRRYSPVIDTKFVFYQILNNSFVFDFFFTF